MKAKSRRDLKIRKKKLKLDRSHIDFLQQLLLLPPCDGFIYIKTTLNKLSELCLWRLTGWLIVCRMFRKKFTREWRTWRRPDAWIVSGAMGGEKQASEWKFFPPSQLSRGCFSCCPALFIYLSCLERSLFDNCILAWTPIVGRRKRALRAENIFMTKTWHNENKVKINCKTSCCSARARRGAFFSNCTWPGR